MFYNYLIFNMVTLSLRILLKYCVSLFEADQLAIQEEPKTASTTTEESEVLNLITIDLVKKMVDWDRRKRILKDWQWKVMDDVVKGKKQLDDRLKFGIYANLKRLRSMGFHD